ncbi:MAG: tRNA pseudouridine(38-40) synthase TruA [Dehalococcoidia bacterium]
MLRRFALLLEYDGTAYAGSQLQNDQPTIQGCLETALERIASRPVRADFAGRTDSGVHATGQVAAFSSDRPLDAGSWQRALNGNLPDDIAVQAATEAPADFDPRRHAIRRHYRYRILNRETRSALERHRAWHVPGRLNLEAMQSGTALFLGRHDFAAFCGSLEEGRTTVRTIFAAGVARMGDSVVFDVAGDAFLPQMVRRLTSALVRLGEDKMQLDELKATLDEARHGESRFVAPPHGLCLVRLEYENLDFGKDHDEDF